MAWYKGHNIGWTDRCEIKGFADNRAGTRHEPQTQVGIFNSDADHKAPARVMGD